MMFPAMCGMELTARAAAPQVAAVENELVVTGSDMTVRYNLVENRYNVLLNSGEILIANSEPAAMAALPDRAEQLITFVSGVKSSWFKETLSGAGGAGARVEIKQTLQPQGLELRFSITTYENEPGLLFSLEVKNKNARAAYIGQLMPMRAIPETGGAAFLGLNPSGAQTLTNTCNADAYPDLKLSAAGVESESCWFAAAFDPTAKRGIVMGMISPRDALPRLRIGFNAAAAVREPGGMRVGFSPFEAAAVFKPAMRLAQNASLASPDVVVFTSWSPPLGALADFARLNIRKPIPADMPDLVFSAQADTDAVNIAIEAAAPFAPFASGMILIHTDPPLTTADDTAFLKPLIDAIHEKGLLAGVRTAPFIMPKNPKAAYLKPVPEGTILAGASYAVLDISMPEAKERAAKFISRLTGSLGADVIEFEETRHVLNIETYFLKGRSAQALYSDAVEAVLAAAAPDARFIFADGPAYLLAGMGNGARLPAAPTLRGGYTRLARGSFFNGVTWRVYPGLPPGDATDPAAAMFWLTAEALCGAGIEPGPAALGSEIILRLLPAWRGPAAAPVDLFSKEIPEILSLDVGLGDMRWKAAGIFHPGLNKLTANGAPLMDTTRDIHVAFSSLSLPPRGQRLIYDYSKRGFLGALETEAVVSLEPGAARLLVIKPVIETPVLLSSNMHFTMDAAVVTMAWWDPLNRALRITVRARPGKRYRLTVFIPAAYTYVSHGFDSQTVKDHTVSPPEIRDGILNITFTPQTAADVNIEIRFTDTTTGAQ